MTDQAYGRQIALDSQGGAPHVHNPQDDIQHLREGGQTDYKSFVANAREPFDRAAISKRTFETRFRDVDVPPSPIAVQEDRSLLVYDFVQKMYNVVNGAGGTVTAELDVVEADASWMIDRLALFGTATGFMRLHDGTALDTANCFATQAGVATLLGGVQIVTGVILSPRTPLTLVVVGGDANAQLSVGIWYRKVRWVWTPPKFIIDGSGMSDINEVPIAESVGS